nr:MAG TPA: chitin synthase regulator [Caudoviricetes sp.]
MNNDIWWLVFLVMIGIFIIILGLGLIALLF